MKPTTTLLTIVVLILAVLRPNLVRSGESVPTASKNVVILLADDLGWGDVGFHGGDAETPNIDRLAAEGVQLDRFYAYPACSPARAAMLTGRFPHRYGISGPVRPRDAGLSIDETLLPASFQQAGYRTSLIGKWHLGHAENRSAHPNARGFDHFYGFLGESLDYFEHTSTGGVIDWQRNGDTIDEDGYSTDLLAAEAVKLISSRSETKPFCMVVSFNAPHNPFQAPQALVAKYSDRLDGRTATYAAMIDSMDQAIGRIVRAIDQSGQRDNTIIVFASDNGGVRIADNGDFRGMKRQAYEGGIHVPCVIRAPGMIEAGSHSDQLVAIHDLFPTLAAATGVPIVSSKPLDGVSVWGNLTAGTTASRCLVIAESDYAVLSDDWKLVQAADGSTELFNLRDDAQETRDGKTQHADVVRRLTKQLVGFRSAVSLDVAYDFRPVVRNQVADAGVAKHLTTTVVPGSQEGESLSLATLRGDVKYGQLGDRRVESNGFGIRLLTAEDLDGNAMQAGEATLPMLSIDPQQRWYRLEISGMAQDGFEVEQDELYLKAEFFQESGEDSLDLIKTRIYPQVLRERGDLKDSATNESLGHGIWRDYSMEFRTPFAQVDRLKVSVGFVGGKATGKRSEFWVRRMDVTPIPVPADYQPPKAAYKFPQPDPKNLVSLGGRWYFDPRGGDRSVPKQFDYRNADQLLYKAGRYEAPFASNMSSWLRSGYLDFNGELVDEDVEKPFSLIVTFTKDHMVMRSRNLPNHPTATFPDRWRMLDGNPAHIQEQANTWYLPLEPKRNPNAIAMDAKNSNQALPMGAIGVATNGVIFFNPFDHIFETDAVWRLDRCCGHPSPRNQYHYHKYPVCVKTPWSDEGGDHSSVIGFAFDGLPVYGPYERNGVLAKNDTQNPLNDFNLHEDADRGPHYHVTPGQYPHIIGGYWGELETLNRPGRR